MAPVSGLAKRPTSEGNREDDDATSPGTAAGSTEDEHGHALSNESLDAESDSSV